MARFSASTSKSIELAIAFDHELRLVRVALEQRFDGEVDQRLGTFRHVEQALLERRELVVKVAVATAEATGQAGPFRHQPNLPVMNASVRASRGPVKSARVFPTSTIRPSSRNTVRSETRAA